MPIAFYKSLDVVPVTQGALTQSLIQREFIGGAYDISSHGEKRDIAREV